MESVRLAVLVSGSGTILESIVDSGIDVNLVVADRACRALEVASSRGLRTALVDRKAYGGFSKDFDRTSFTRELVSILARGSIGLIAMAGFGTVTSDEIYVEFENRILNTHPSLLPAFKGWHAVRDALAAGATETGCTVHVSQLEMDAGPILAQERVRIEPDDTEASLHERIKDVERAIYPAVIAACRTQLARGQDLSSLAMS